MCKAIILNFMLILLVGCFTTQSFVKKTQERIYDCTLEMLDKGVKPSDAQKICQETFGREY